MRAERCILFTEDYRPGTMGGPAGGCALLNGEKNIGRRLHVIGGSREVTSIALMPPYHAPDVLSFLFVRPKLQARPPTAPGR